MFAARANQENAIYEQQTAAVAKGQALKGLAPKTPAGKAHKTPFQTRRNDENVPGLTIKQAGEKSGGPGRNAFVTPAGPRSRAPLGVKTTNAKALQTPAPLVIPSKHVSAKPSSPRMRRPKIKVHEAAPTEAENVLESDEDDIEYMPPRGIPLPDYPDDIWPHDRDYPQLHGQNLTRGWFAEYRAEEDGHKDQDALSDLGKKCKRVGETHRKQQADGASACTKHSGPKVVPTTLKAQTAAIALANRPSKPTGTTRPGAALNAPLLKSTSAAPRSSSAGNPRFNAAKAASKNTIGYSKGRTVSSFTRKPLSEVHGRDPPRKPPTADRPSTLDDLLRLDSLDMGSDDDGGIPLSSSHGLDPLLVGDGGLEDFQLETVET